MSNQARLLLLSGTGGSGTTSACAATVAALEDEGLRARLLDPFARPIDDAAEQAAVSELLGVRAGSPVEWWGSQPSIAHLAAWHRMRDAATQEGVDAVVVDLGDLRQATQLIDFPYTALRVLDAALTPALASSSDADAEDSAFGRLSQARDAMTASIAVLGSDLTSMRLVAEARPHSVERVLRSAAVLAMLGVDVDGIVVNRCARKSDGADSSVLHDQRELLARVERESDGPWVWKATGSIRAVPKGVSAMGPLGRSRVLRESSLGVQAADEAYLLEIPLGRVAAASAQVGRYEDRLVVSFDGASRWLDLPPVLKRCRAVDAERTAHGLRVQFTPDPGLWREDTRIGGAA